MPTGVYERTPEYRAKMSAVKKGTRMPPSAVAKISGPLNTGWKGDAVSYVGLHQWIYRARGAASTHPCAQADETCDGRMEWANISGLYLRELSDYMVLCQSHHVRFDGTANGRKTHCPQGHPFDAENTIQYVTKKGRIHRRCRECKRIYDRHYKAARHSPNVSPLTP